MRKPRTRKEMIEYLSNHFRYNTMNSWNRSTSYAVCVKVDHVPGLTKEQRDACYAMLDVDDGVWDESGYNQVLEEFAEENRWEWQIGTNGRSGGYLVLYQGYRKQSEHKSVCPSCGQRNFEAATPESNKCGRCGKTGRYNHTFYEKGCWPGRSTDMDEDFSTWTTHDLKARTELVRMFDKACAAAVEQFVWFAMENKAVKKTVMVPHEVTVVEAR
jgi:ribosomal protein S27AE